MLHPRITLSRQDLADFLEGNEQHMDAYASELQSRLSKAFGDAEVEISRNALTDRFDLDNEDDQHTVNEIMNRMVNDWSWLPD
jgi:hypothetical protein